MLNGICNSPTPRAISRKGRDEKVLVNLGIRMSVTQHQKLQARADSLHCSLSMAARLAIAAFLA